MSRVYVDTTTWAPSTFPNADSPDPSRELGYSVSDIEGYDGRTIRVYPTAQDAVAQMDLLRDQLNGCARDND